MHLVLPGQLWLGHAGDVRDVRPLMESGIAAVVDLAINEPQPRLPREMVYCRFPLVDGEGNRAELLRLAIDTLAVLLRSRIPTLVYCSAGMSRSLAVAAAAWAAVHGFTPSHSLLVLSKSCAHDVSPTLWRDVVAACAKDND